MLTPGPRPVTAALRVMGWATERPSTNDHRVWNRATWSARPGSRLLVGLRITGLLPPGATLVLGADESRGTPFRTPAQGRRLLPRGGALLEEPRHPVVWPQRGGDDALGACALEPARVGLALSHHPVPASRAAGSPTPQDQDRLGAAGEAAGAPLAAGTSAGRGGRGGLCRRVVGPGGCEASRRHGLAPALECCPG